MHIVQHFCLITIIVWQLTKQNLYNIYINSLWISIEALMVNADANVT